MIFHLRDTVHFSGYLPVDRPMLRSCLMLMANHLEKKYSELAQEICLYIVDDKTIGVANVHFMSCAGPTNILSFPGGRHLPASMILSLDTFFRECHLYGQSPSEHLIRLLAHGLCHLAGLDHGEQMEKETENLMQLVQCELAASNL